MELPELVKIPNAILRETLPDFDFASSENAIDIAHILAKSMIKYGGAGIAANQLGLKHRCFAMKSNPIIVAFNPKIVDTSEEMIELEEGCLSIPGLNVKIKRPRSIRVRYTEPNGNVVTQKFTDLTARIFQHELDHLNGILITDRISRLKKHMAIKKGLKRRA